jgi:hypothetical protein
MKIELTIELLVDNYQKTIKIPVESVEFAKHWDLLFLAEPQHVNYFTTIRFNENNDNHQRYLERGLLFKSEADVLLFSKSFLISNRQELNK